jgi:hypothetical protein
MGQRIYKYTYNPKFTFKTNGYLFKPDGVWIMLDNLKLEKESPIPLYYQLKELIKTEIQNDHLSYGDAIPSEREFVDVCQISRPTVRQA